MLHVSKSKSLKSQDLVIKDCVEIKPLVNFVRKTEYRVGVDFRFKTKVNYIVANYFLILSITKIGKLFTCRNFLAIIQRYFTEAF